METNAVTTIAYRDVLKFFRDPARLLSTFIFPILFVAILGGSLQFNLGSSAGFDFLKFTFTGVYAQTLFQSAALGIISIIEDRENDFSQELFVSPISRYSIIFGKIVGESLVALVQGIAIVAFGIIIGVQFSPIQALGLIPTGIAVCLFGGAFGVLILSRLNSQRSANQIFPFIFLPQFFLAGVFNPIQVLPIYLEVLSRISPMRYAIDLVRGVFYRGTDEYPRVVLEAPAINLAVITTGFAVFLVVGTILFVRSERNR